MSATQSKEINIKKKVLISAIFAFVACLVFIPILVSDSNANSWFFAITIGIPLVFVLSFIFCLLFLIFKTYQKLVYFFFGIAVLTIIIGFSSFGDFFIKNIFINKSIPEEYQNYHSLETNKPFTFGNYIVKPFMKSDFAIDRFISPENNLIIITYKQSEDYSSDQSLASRIFYKLNKRGDVVSSYTKIGKFNDNEIIIGNYFINPTKAYYNSWIGDNDTIRKPFIIQNKDKSWSRSQENILLEKIKNHSKYYYKTTDVSNSRNVLIYFSDNKWHQFFTDLGLSDLERDLGVEHLKEDYQKPTNISPIYENKIKYGSFDAPYGAMQSGSERVLTLEADFFCHLYIKNDTLKFKMPVTLFEDRAEDKIFWNMKGESVQNHKKTFRRIGWPYVFFSNKNFDFQLFESSSYTFAMENNLYIIKPIR